MASINTGIRMDSQFLNLKEMPFSEVRKEVEQLLVNNEEMVAAFNTVRDQVVFTNKRIFVINVQGVVGKKVSYFSYPYSKIQHFGIETAGLLDIDSELVATFSDGTVLQFDFRAKVDIKRISALISQYIL